MPGIGDNKDPAQLLVERILNVAQRKRDNAKTDAEDLKDLYEEAKAKGEDIKVLKLMIKNMLEPEKKAERDELQRRAEEREAALGPHRGLPLVDHALEQTY